MGANIFDLRVRNCSNQPVRNEGFILASDAAPWTDDASLVQVTSGAVLALNFTSQRECSAAPANSSNKVISGNAVKFTSVNNLTDHIITRYRICHSGKSVFHVCTLINYNK
jgi:hypothetical protein